MNHALEIKYCCGCELEKPTSEFIRNSRTKDGLHWRCNPCRKAQKREHYERRRESYIARAQRLYSANKARKRDYDRQYRERRAEHLDRIKATWRAENAAKVKEIKREWKRRNPHIVRENAMRRNAAKKSATPWWLTGEHKAQINEIYLDAATRPNGPWHVDHIVPLNGKEVCGLHVPWNLQVLPAAENVAKGNRLLEAA